MGYRAMCLRQLSLSTICRMSNRFEPHVSFIADNCCFYNSNLFILPVLRDKVRSFGTWFQYLIQRTLFRMDYQFEKVNVTRLVSIVTDGLSILLVNNFYGDKSYLLIIFMMKVFSQRKELWGPDVTLLFQNFIQNNVEFNIFKI